MWSQETELRKTRGTEVPSALGLAKRARLQSCYFIKVCAHVTSHEVTHFCVLIRCVCAPAGPPSQHALSASVQVVQRSAGA